jgi:hypothetical protein
MYNIKIRMSHQNNGSEREAGHHDIIEKKRLHRYWPRHKDARGENTKIMERIPQERRKRGCPRKTWMEGVQAAMTTGNLELDQWRNREEWLLTVASPCIIIQFK